jgi:uncharacterized protein involved in exopolysaccharide biosynthesis
MSRIDEALKRLTGVVAPEPRTPPVLDRFASEGEVDRPGDTKRSPKVESRRLASLVVPNRTPLEDRTVAAVAVAAAAAAKPVAAPPSQELSNHSVDTAAHAADEKLIDIRQAVDYVGFVIRSVGRHKMLAGAAFLAVVAVVVAAAFLLPRVYYVEVKLLAQRNAVMTALSNPGRAVPWDADAPTRAAAETVLRRDNLISLITQTDLINEWDRRRSMTGRMKDWLVARVTRHEPTVDDKLDALVWRLENYMFVTAGPVGDGTVTIALYWPDGEMAYRIVERARQAFLEARQVAETSAISESITILERYSTSLHEDVNRTLGELTRTQPRDRTGTDAPPRVSGPARPRRSALAAVLDPVQGGQATDAPAPNPELARLKNQLSDKHDELIKLESARQKALSEAQAKLAALQTVYTASHPSVQNVQQNVTALQHESPQVAALQTTVDELETKYDQLAAVDAERIDQENARQRAAAPRIAETIPQPEPVVDSPAPAPAPAPAPRQSQVAEFANLRLRTELGQLQSILERTDGARIELAVSEAAFKYRYTVIKPAQVPREPESPNLRLILVAGLLAAVLLSVAAAVASDLISNRILEPWQVERQLGLPILGSVRLA